MNATRGEVVERKFKEWLDQNEIPHWYIQQDIDSFSPALKKYFTKRPDFMILIPNIGFFLVDATYKSPAEKYPKFFVNADEVVKYSQLQRVFNLHVWYAISHEHYQTWFWIPVSKVLEVGERMAKKDGSEYYSVPIKEFIQVSIKDSIERIFTHVLR